MSKIAELYTGTEIEKDVKIDAMTEAQLLDKIKDSFKYDREVRSKYRMNWNFYETGKILADNEYNLHKVEFQIAKRFCRTHANYVLKDRPNIQVPPVNAIVPELRQQANYLEKSLNNWWSNDDVFLKLKRGTLHACVKGDHVFYLSANSEKKWVTFNSLEADNFMYETATGDPYSPMTLTLRQDLIDADMLKRKYPAFKDRIIASASSKVFGAMPGFLLSAMRDSKKAIYTEIMDGKYIYKFVNEMMVEGPIEHNYPFLPYYPLRYFDSGTKNGGSLIDFIRDPIKFINQIFGQKVDVTTMTSSPTLVVSGANPTIDISGKRGGKITIPAGGTANYLQPPNSPISLNDLLNVMKAFLHLLSGLSEEAMAGFVGSLTAAGVAIELRLDSTVREALDVQANLQSLIQRINRDWLKLMEKFFGDKDLFDLPEIGKTSDVAFKASGINGFYHNVVDFGGILPRSEDQIVRNTIAKQNAGLVSKHTALEELRYIDPDTELAKINRERIDDTRLAQQLQAGQTPDGLFFNTPKEAIDYILTEDKLPLVHPSQNHQEYIDAIDAKLKTTQNILLVAFKMAHLNMMKGAATPQVAPTQEAQAVLGQAQQQQIPQQGPPQGQAPIGPPPQSF